MLRDFFYKIYWPAENSTPPRETSLKRTTEEDDTTCDRSCTICMESKAFGTFKTDYNKDCNHRGRTICDDCMYKHVSQACNTGPTIQCPECSVDLSHDAIKMILLKFDNIELYDRYAKLELNRILEKNPEFLWCAHGCGSGQLNENSEKNKAVQCVNCKKSTCFTHKCPWHEGMTCKEYDMPVNARQRHACDRWIKDNTKKCPQCRSNIEKNGGCDHMTCYKCKYQFCWECMAAYSRIQQRDAYQHYRSCKNYPARETRSFLRRLRDLF